MTDKLKPLLGSAEIVFVCKTGSSLFCSRCNDDDLLVVVKNADFDFKHFRLENTCVFCYSQEEFEKFATLKLDDYRAMFSLAALLATEDNVLYGQNPVENYNWWNYRKQALEKVTKFGKQNFLNNKIYNAKNRAACTPKMIWGLATCYVLQNGSAVFTEEQKNILQLCHDNCLPLVYRNVLEKDLQQLQEQLQVV